MSRLDQVRSANRVIYEDMSSNVLQQAERFIVDLWKIRSRSPKKDLNHLFLSAFHVSAAPENLVIHGCSESSGAIRKISATLFITFHGLGAECH
jgi:hypothetical protein